MTINLASIPAHGQRSVYVTDHWALGGQNRRLPGLEPLCLLSDHPAKEEDVLEVKLHGAWFTHEVKRELHFSLYKKLELKDLFRL